MTERLRKPFLRFEAHGLIREHAVSFRHLLIEAAKYDVIWVHQYLSNAMIFDILGNAASDQAVILTGEGHEPEMAQFGACFQPCPNVSIVEISESAVARSRRFGSRLWSVSAGVWRREILTPEPAKLRGQICSAGRILPHKGVEITIAGSPFGSSLKIIGARTSDTAYLKFLSTVPVRAEVEYLGESATQPNKKRCASLKSLSRLRQRPCTMGGRFRRPNYWDS